MISRRERGALERVCSPHSPLAAQFDHGTFQNARNRTTHTVTLKIISVLALILALAVVARFVALGIASGKPPTLGLQDGHLKPCPRKPNCVSSLARGKTHSIAPLSVAGPGTAAIELARNAIESMTGGRVVAVDDGYLRAAFRSRLFRFVDDLELLWDDQAEQFDIRAASRVGTSDLGVNRKRVEELRRRLSSTSAVPVD